MDKGKLIITDEMHPILVEKMTEYGFKCLVYPHATKEELTEMIEDASGIIINSRMVIDADVIDRAGKLSFIARGGSGKENIDEVYAKSKGIVCISSPEGNRDAVAEHVLGMLLGLFNKIPQASLEVRNKKWNREENRGIEIKGLTIGIVGYGNTGSTFAKLLTGFNANILAYDKYIETFGNGIVKETNMDNIFDQADILSLHLPLTKETAFLVDDAYINKFRKDIYLLNSSRGKIVKTADLVKNLESGKLKGVALDVLENEDFDTYNSEENEWFDFLSNSDKVLLTPHIAGWTMQSKRRIAEVVSSKIMEFYDNS
ncbi:MAG: hypothetical protein IIA45_14700 [Bacteroidetes bacterium]|nr:hypothetical protein [Bacteroidota bacterium]